MRFRSVYGTLLLLTFVVASTPGAEAMTVRAVMKKGVDYIDYNIEVDVDYSQISQNMTARHGKSADHWRSQVRAHVAPVAACFGTPALERGLTRALGDVLNDTVRQVVAGAYIGSLTLNVVENTTNFYEKVRFSLYGAVVSNSSGVFLKSGWRALNASKDIDASKFGGSGVINPGKMMMLDLSAFKTPLEKWSRTYDSATNTTTFTYKTDVTIRTPFGTMYIDPDQSITVPGNVAAYGDDIVIYAAPAVLPILPLGGVVVAVVVVAMVGVVVYRRSRKPRL